MHLLSINNLALNPQIDGGSEGAPILFINSLGSDLRSWDTVISLLLTDPEFADRPLIRYDKRGHGLSDCPPAPYSISDHASDLDGLINELGFDKVILVGISVGGMIAMDYAARHIDTIESLVLCDTAAKIGTTEGWNTRIDALRAHGMDHMAEAILERWFAPAFIRNQPAAFNIYKNMLTRTPVEGYTGTCEAIRDADLHPLLETITVPTLVMCGAEDQATTPEDCRKLTALLPDALFVEIKNAAHLPCVEQPETFVTALTGFLQNLK